MTFAFTPIRKKQLVWVLVVVCLIVIFDQVTKTMIMARIPEGSETLGTHQGEFFWLTHQRNRGLVGGMFGDSALIPFVAPVFATLVLVYLFSHLNPLSRWQSITYGMIAGGAIGNLIDRFRLGSVTDFLQFHFHFIPIDFPWKIYPAFNIADSAICVGVVVLMFLTMRDAKEVKKSNAPDTA